MGRLLVLGISGPIASGKGLAIQTVKQLSPRAHIFSADREAHRAYAKGTSLSRELISHFGADIRKRGGGVNRKKLGDIVFSHPKELRYLNRLTHQKIRKILRYKIMKARKRGVRLFIVDAALLHTIPLHSFVRQSWVVLSKESVRIARLVRNRKMPRSAALARVRAQKNIPFQCAKDRILTNNGTRGEFIRKVRMAYNDLLRHGRI